MSWEVNKMRDQLQGLGQGLAVSPTLREQRERITRERKFLTDRIATIDRALELLDKYPEMEELTDLLRQI